MCRVWVWVCGCVCCAHHCHPVLPLCCLQLPLFPLATCTASDCDLHAADGRPPGEDGGANTVWCTLFTACRHGACGHTELLPATLGFSRVPALHTNACFSLLVFGHPVSVCLSVCTYVVRVSWSPCRLSWKRTVQACIDKGRSTGGTRVRSTH